MEILAIIPAREGSKGLLKKNIKNLGDKPLVAYTIEAVLKSKYVSRVIVSTDNKEIAQISKQYGAEVPFIRPIELAKDESPTIDAIVHAINWIEENENKEYEYICLLQCTSPFRTTDQIDEAIEKLINEDGDSIVSVCEVEQNPYWMKKIENKYLVDFIKQEKQYTRRQDIPKLYRLNGAIYIIKKETLLNERSFFAKKTIPYIMDKLTSLDIDDIIDFKLAEMLMEETR